MPGQNVNMLISILNMPTPKIQIEFKIKIIYKILCTDWPSSRSATPQTVTSTDISPAKN